MMIGIYKKGVLYLLITILAISYSKVFGQEKEIFTVSVDTVNTLENFNSKKSKVLYKDSKYKVTYTCSGEWGGTVIFTNRLFRTKYQASATCPDLVFKYDSHYYVVANLQHLMPSTEILRIDSPKEMERRGLKGIKRALSRKFFESESRKGIDMVLDTFNLQTLMKIGNPNQNYFIMSHYEMDLSNGYREIKSTFIAKVENNEVTKVQSLLDEYIFIMDSKPYLHNETTKGYFRSDSGDYSIEVLGNTININFLPDK